MINKFSWKLQILFHGYELCVEVDIIMSILYFTIIAFYFAIKSGWKTPKYFSFSDVEILVERGEQMGRLWWLGGVREIIVVISWYSDDPRPATVPVVASSRQLIG